MESLVFRDGNLGVGYFTKRATSQRLGSRPSKASQDATGGRALRLGRMGQGQTWEVAALEIAQLGSCHLGKYPWEVADWEKAFGKVPNIETYE